MENDKPERPTTLSPLVSFNTVFVISATISLILLFFTNNLNLLGAFVLSIIFVSISGFLTIVLWLINFFASLSRMDNILFHHSLVYCIYVIAAPIIGGLILLIANIINFDWHIDLFLEGLGIATFVIINVAGLIHLDLLRKKQPLL